MAARKSLERDIGSLYFILERIDDLKVQYELIAYLKNNPSLSYENKVRFINRGVFGSLAQTIQAIGERGKGLTESTKVALICIPFSDLQEIRNLISHKYAGATVYKGKIISIKTAKSVLVRDVLVSDRCISALQERLNHCKKVVANRQNQGSTNMQNGYSSYKPNRLI